MAHLASIAALGLLVPAFGSIAGCTRAGWTIGARARDAGSAAPDEATAGDIAPADIGEGTDTSARDGGVPPVLCGDWREGAFSFEPPARLAGLSDPSRSEEQPQLSYDGLTINFGRAGDIYQAVRTAPEQPFDAPEPVAGLATPNSELGAFFTADRLTAYVMSDAPGGLGDLDIWRYERASVDDAFVSQRNVAELNTPRNDWDPFLTYDGRRIYGARVVSESLYEFWSAEAVGAGSFGTPTPISELDTLPLKGNPSLTYDERVIVFNGRAPRELDYRLFYALRPHRDAPFGAPRLVPGIEGAAIEPFLSADGCSLYFAATPPQRTDNDLYVARFRPL